MFYKSTMEIIGNGKDHLKETEGGNSNSPSDKRCIPAKYWCLTWNNYIKEQMETLIDKCEKDNIKYVFGREVALTGTPHIQGYLEAPKKIRPLEKFGKGGHWEKAISGRDANIMYCTKGGDYETNFVLPYKGIDLPNSWNENQLSFLTYFEDAKKVVNDREILWVYGGYHTGKSKLCKTICFKNNKTARLVYGTCRDALFSIDEDTKIVCINIVKDGSINYSLLEQLKDGMWYSTKYEGKMILMDPPIVCIFSNQLPDGDRIDINRIKLFNLSEVYMG